MKKSELKKLIREEIQTNEKTPISQRLNYLKNLGFKNYELEVVKDMGVYFISLPHNAYNMDIMGSLVKGFGKNSTIGYFPNISKGSLSIKTDLKY